VRLLAWFCFANIGIGILSHNDAHCVAYHFCRQETVAKVATAVFVYNRQDESKRAAAEDRKKIILLILRRLTCKFRMTGLM
jgi:hypothetical protein